MADFTIGNTKVPVSIRPNGRLKSRKLSVNVDGALIEGPEETLGDVMPFLEAMTS